MASQAAAGPLAAQIWHTCAEWAAVGWLAARHRGLADPVVELWALHQADSGRIAIAVAERGGPSRAGRRCSGRRQAGLATRVAVCTGPATVGVIEDLRALQPDHGRERRKMMEPSKLTPDQVKAKLDAGEPVTVLDDRSPKAWDASDVKIPGALRVPPGDVEQHLAEIGTIPKHATIVTYCT
jgi:hypothetical protein